MTIKELIEILQGEDQDMCVKVWSEATLEFVDTTKEDIDISELCGCDEEPPIDHFLVIDIRRKV